MLMGSQVAECVYGFVQAAFSREYANESKTIRLDRSCESLVFGKLTMGWLATADIDALPACQKRVLYELLIQYIMFLEMNRSLPFPDNFLDGSSSQQLGSALLGYIRQHSWPFPQLMPH